MPFPCQAQTASVASVSRTTGAEERRLKKAFAKLHELPAMYPAQCCMPQAITTLPQESITTPTVDRKPSNFQHVPRTPMEGRFPGASWKSRHRANPSKWPSKKASGHTSGCVDLLTSKQAVPMPRACGSLCMLQPRRETVQEPRKTAQRQGLRQVSERPIASSVYKTPKYQEVFQFLY